jgi:hypothetical protein
MRAADAHRIEAGIGYAATASFAAAVGFAAFHAAGRISDLRGMVAAAMISGLLACPVGFVLLRRLEGRAEPFPQPLFDLATIEPVGELLLTDADRLEPAASEALMLEDALDEMAPDSRVVQLFDRTAMPTPDELQARIDRRLVGGTSHSATPDASEALFAALADLRRSLR